MKGFCIFATQTRRMGLFKNIFGASNLDKEISKKYINWISLNSLEQLQEIKEQSKTESIVMFKHSTRCGISRGVLKQFENSFDEELSSLKIYYLDLLNFREISNEIATQFKIVHESPQLIVIKNGVTVKHASHYDIMSIDLKQYV